MRRYSAVELFTFYITDQHWLHMDRDKMLLIMEGIRKDLNDLIKWEAAYDLVQNATKEEIKEMKIAYYNRYGWKQLRAERHRIYPKADAIKIEVNQN